MADSEKVATNNVHTNGSTTTNVESPPTTESAKQAAELEPQPEQLESKLEPKPEPESELELQTQPPKKQEPVTEPEVEPDQEKAQDTIVDNTDNDDRPEKKVEEPFEEVAIVERPTRIGQQQTVNHLALPESECTKPEEPACDRPSSSRPATTSIDLGHKKVPPTILRLKDGSNGDRADEDDRIRKKEGMYRHMIALLALSSIVLANMNRQAFNQALVIMTKTHVTPPLIEPDNNSSSTLVTTEEPKYLNFEKIFEEDDPVTTPPPPLAPEEGAEESEGGTSLAPDQGQEEGAAVAAQIDGDAKTDEEDQFDWSGNQIGTLQAAFSYGYMPFMILGGRMSELYGAKWVVFLSGFGSALCSLLSPFFADTDFRLLVGSRVVMGLCQTGVSPALYALLTRWLPQDESSVYLPMIKVGVMVGLMSGALLGGSLSWRWTFYSAGLVSLIWSIMWALLVSSDPNDHWLIGKRELEYIRWEFRRLNKGRKQSIGSARRAAAPWFRILTNPVVVAFMLCKFTIKLSNDAQTMQLPMYLRNVLHASKKMNRNLSAINYAIQGVFTGLVAYIAKEFVVRKTFGMNKTIVRRLFQGICNFGMGLAYILLTFNMSSMVVVFCAIIMLSVTSMFGAGGEAVLPIDLTANYSGSIMAIANSFANLSGIVLPTLAAFILDNQLNSSEHWNNVWRVVGGLIMLGGLMFVWRVKAEIQDFSSPAAAEQKEEANTNSNNKTNEIELSPTRVMIEMKPESRGHSNE